MNEREPLLSEQELPRYDLVEDPWYGQSMAKEEHGRFVLYEELENLIKEGRLREVKKVEFRTNDYDCYMECSACNWHICWQYVEDNPMRFCPGCGNPTDTDTGDIPLG